VDVAMGGCRGPFWPLPAAGGIAAGKGAAGAAAGRGSVRHA
jgi:hypothetical protein